MRVTNVKLDLHKSDDPNCHVRAYAELTFDDELVVRGVKVIQTATGLTVGFPIATNDDGEINSIVYPTDSVFRSFIEKGVLQKYHATKASYTATCECKIDGTRVSFQIPDSGVMSAEAAQGKAINMLREKLTECDTDQWNVQVELKEK